MTTSSAAYQKTCSHPSYHKHSKVVYFPVRDPIFLVRPNVEKIIHGRFLSLIRLQHTRGDSKNEQDDGEGNISGFASARESIGVDNGEDGLDEEKRYASCWSRREP